MLKLQGKSIDSPAVQDSYQECVTFPCIEVESKFTELAGPAREKEEAMVRLKLQVNMNTPLLERDVLRINRSCLMSSL